MSTALKTFLKFAFAFGIIYWLVTSGKLDLKLINKSLNEGYSWLICLAIIATQAAISGLRWKMLIDINLVKKLPTLSIIRVQWIGLFFNSVLPGAVTGDLIKLIYVKDLAPKLSKTFLIMSTLMDRVLGLSGLVILSGFFSLINYQELSTTSPEMRNLIHLNFLLFAGVLCFLITLFLPVKYQDFLAQKIELIPFLGKKIVEVLKQTWSIGHNKSVVIKSLLISVLLQFMNVAAFWVITSPFYNAPLSIDQAFTFIPIGLITIAIPISPNGMGIGHVLFDKLFSYAGIDGGASLFNLFFLCVIINNLLGVIPYLFSKKVTTEAEKETNL